MIVKSKYTKTFCSDELTLYNNIFADQSFDAQNFWVQIGVNIRARRLMSAKIIPNL